MKEYTLTQVETDTGVEFDFSNGDKILFSLGAKELLQLYNKIINDFYLVDKIKKSTYKRLNKELTEEFIGDLIQSQTLYLGCLKRLQPSDIADI